MGSNEMFGTGSDRKPTRLMDVHGDGEEGARRVVQLRMRYAPVNTVVTAQGMRGVVKREPHARSENGAQDKGLDPHVAYRVRIIHQNMDPRTPPKDPQHGQPSESQRQTVDPLVADRGDRRIFRPDRP
jgi:hypothetical protein